MVPFPEKKMRFTGWLPAYSKCRHMNFPIQFSDITRSYFSKMSSFATGQLAEDMKAVSQILRIPKLSKDLPNNIITMP